MKRRLKSFYRGDTKTFKFVVVDVDGVPYNISGWEIWFTMKKNEYDTDAQAVAQKQVILPLSGDLDAEAGIAYITLTSDVTVLIKPEIYFYDFQKVVQQGVGDPPSVTTIMSGMVYVLPDITISI